MKTSVVLYLYGKTAIALIVPCQDMVIRIINDEKLAGLKFGKSANISFWWNNVWRIHSELQVCTGIRLVFANGE